MLFFRYRKRFTVQAKIFVLYKTKLGLRLMDKISKSCPRFLKVLGKIGVITGFAGMLFIFVFLIWETLKFVLISETPPPLAPVFPGINIPGAPNLSFWHWIIAIFIIATVHEFSHGIFARLNNIKVKSSGFAFLGPILAAFVEPSEKQMEKRTKWQQLEVLAAGPFSNIIMGILFLLLFMFITAPIQTNMFEIEGITINDLIENRPMEATGIEVPFTITEINDIEIVNLNTFIDELGKVEPGDSVKLKTDKGVYEVITVEHPDNASRGFIGITGFTQELEPTDKWKDRSYIPMFMIWLNLLIFWIFIINIGVGLFNLLPIGPVDGGKMSLIFLTWAFKGNKSKTKRVWVALSYFVLILIFINLLPWVWKLIMFLLNSLFLLLTLI